MRLVALALLTVLGEDGAPLAGGLWQPVFEALQVLRDRPVVPLPEREPAAIRAAVARIDPAALARFEAD